MSPKPWILGIAIVSLSGITLPPESVNAGLAVRQWYHGTWDCRIDGRAAQMQWLVVNDPRTSCDGDVCSTTSGVKTVGRFSDNGSPWVPLAIDWSSGNRLNIRYQGAEPDNWFLRFNDRTQIATGWTTWRRNRYPLQCQNRR